MSTIPPVVPPALQAAPPPGAPNRAHSVVMGRQDFLSVVIRLIGMELYKLRRRSMSTVLSIIYIFAMLGVFTLFGVIALVNAGTPLELYLPPQCNQGSDTRLATPCLNHPPTQADLAQARQFKQNDIISHSQALRLPDALNIATQDARNVGQILFIILAGTIVGGEYGVGTVRLMFTRGPTRTQFLLAKIGSLLFCIVVSYVIVLLLGTLTGGAFNLVLGVGAGVSLLTWGWVGHALLYILSGIFSLLVYAMLALFLATLGKATAAGVAGALAWSLLEGPIGVGFALVGASLGGPFGDFLRAIPDYLIGPNINALLDDQGRYLFGGQPPTLSVLHAVLVLLVYLAIFIGLSWWISERRDVTN